MTLVELLELNRIGLTELDLRTVMPRNTQDPMDVKGSIAQQLTEEWLSRCQGIIFDEDFPRRVNGYSLKIRGSGIAVYERGKVVHEYDFLIIYNGQPVIVEVKSLKLKGLEAKIPRALSIGRSVYSVDDVQMLVFFPFYTNKIADAERIQATHPEVRCVNLGYKKRQLCAAMKRFCQELPTKVGSV